MRGGQLSWLVGRWTTIDKVQQKLDVNLGHIVKSSSATSQTLSGLLKEKLFGASQTRTSSPCVNWTRSIGRALPGSGRTSPVVSTCIQDEKCCQTENDRLMHHRHVVSPGALACNQAIGTSVLRFGQLLGPRLFASQTAPNSGESKRASRKRSSKSSATPTSPSQPHSPDQQVKLTFEDCLRKVALLIDGLESKRASWTDQKYFNLMLATNARSSGELLKFLDSILPQAKGFPKAAFYTLDFFVLDGEAIRKVRLYFNTTGGDCRKQVHKVFQRFFQECRVAENFRWSPGSWGALHITGRESEQELREKARMIRRSHESGNEDDLPVGADQESGSGEKGDVSLSHVEFPRDRGTDGDLRAAENGVSIKSKSEVLTDGEESVSGSNGRYGEHGSIFSTDETRSEEMEEGVTSIEELIHSLDPALKLVAEQAWGGHDDATCKGVLEMLGSFKQSSPLLGEAISEKIWKGRIGLDDVCEGLEQRDVAIAMSIVFHIHRLIEKQGRPTSWNEA